MNPLSKTFLSNLTKSYLWFATLEFQIRTFPQLELSPREKKIRFYKIKIKIKSFA